MYKEHIILFKRLQLVADFLLMAIAFWLAYGAWRGELPEDGGAFTRFLWLVPTAALLWLFFLDANGLYHSYRTLRGDNLASGIFKSLAQGTAVLAALLFLVGADVSRSLMLLFAATSFVLLVAGRLTVRAVLTRVRERGWNYNSILVLGTGRSAQDLIRALRRNAHLGLRVVGCLGTHPDETGAVVEGAPVLGTVEDFERMLAENPLDEVAIALPEVAADKLTGLIALCEREGVKARVIADLYRPSAAQLVVEEIEGLPVVTFSVAPGVGWQLLCKEVIDRLGAIALLVLCVPLLALVALAIKLDSPGPILFTQERLGLRKRRFRLYKFRTMVDGAEAQQATLAALNESPEPAFKIRDDPRVTPAGRWLRRFSIDELPQLWNVLRGEMSFIGPRPPLPDEVARYEQWQRRRLSMKPGMSGLWQVAGRGKKLEFADWVRLDLEYIDSWSLALDLRILLWTLPVVLFGSDRSRPV